MRSETAGYASGIAAAFNTADFALLESSLKGILDAMSGMAHAFLEKERNFQSILETLFVANRVQQQKESTSRDGRADFVVQAIPR